MEHFTVVDLFPQPSSACEADADLVLIQLSFALLWKLSLKNTSKHKNKARFRRRTFHEPNLIL